MTLDFVLRIRDLEVFLPPGTHPWHASGRGVLVFVSGGFFFEWCFEALRDILPFLYLSEALVL